MSSSFPTAILNATSFSDSATTSARKRIRCEMAILVQALVTRCKKKLETDRRSVAVRCMLYKIRCNPMLPLNGALPGHYVPVLVTRGARVAYRYTYAPPRCRTSQSRRTFISFLVSLRNDLADSVFDGVGLAGFKSRANAFSLG